MFYDSVSLSGRNCSRTVKRIRLKFDVNLQDLNPYGKFVHITKLNANILICFKIIVGYDGKDIIILGAR